MQRLRILPAILISLALDACSAGSNDGPDAGDNTPTPDGGSTTTPPDGGTAAHGTRVGPEGGTVLGPGTVLEIPAGALTEATDIEITTTTTTIPEGLQALTPVFRFTPEGLTFHTPATVKIAVPATPPADAKIYWSKAGGASGFDALSTQSTSIASQPVLTAEVTHFSLGFVAAPPPPAGSCSAVETAIAAMDAAAPPTGTVQPLGSVVTLGASGSVYLTGGDLVGAPGFVARDGHTLRPIAANSPRGSVQVDAVNDLAYVLVQDGADLVLKRLPSTGCLEDVHRFTASTDGRVLGFGPTGDVVVAITPTGSGKRYIWVGRNMGASWTQGGEHAAFFSATTATIAPSDPNRIYVGIGVPNSATATKNIATSKDGGATWTVKLLQGIVSGTNFGVIQRLAVSPTDPNLVYAATNDVTYKSTNGGDDWAATFTDIPTMASWLAFSADGRLWAAGQKAHLAGNHDLNEEGLLVRDTSGNWTALNGDLPAEDVPATTFGLMLSGATPELVRVGRHLWHSMDGGAHWVSTFAGAGAQVADRRLTHPTDAKTFYTFVRDIGGVDGLWKTTDGGATFDHVLAGKNGKNAAILGDGTLLLLSGVDQDPTHVGWRSTDGGATTSVMVRDTATGTFFGDDQPGFPAIMLDADQKGAYVHVVPDLWRTLDSGATWQKVTSPDVSDGVSTTAAWVLADPAVAHHLVAVHPGAMGREIVSSTDGGDSWTAIPLPVTSWTGFDAPLLTFDAAGTLLLVVPDATQQAQLFALPTGTTTWVTKGRPLFFGTQLRTVGSALVLDQQVSTDGGATWTFGNPATAPWMIDLAAFSMRADPTKVVFSYQGLRVGSL